MKKINEFTDKSCKNVDYMETIRGMCWELHEKKGISYAAMSRECKIGYGTLANFAACYRDTMNKNNWLKFSAYIEDMYNKLLVD